MASSRKSDDLAAEARRAANRVALYQQRVYAGRADGRRLAELQREAAGAAERAARHVDVPPEQEKPDSARS
jgi:hypothetical protein